MPVFFGHLPVQAVSRPFVISARRDEELGEGQDATASNLVRVSFVVRSKAGKELANSNKRGLDFWFVPSEYSAPLSELVIGMRPGGVRLAEVLYRSSEFRSILPAGAPVEVELRLLEIKK